ncbi:MAG: N-6 DNA methylase, partial [Candidatus Bathyarchaeia archaeon]
GSALKVIQKQETFQCILMNPPFGAKIRSDFGARSETALTYLALDHLAQDGRAALLVPSGLLFAGSQAESNLRKRLVDEFTLEAIITLPEDALQPYSSLTAHLILVLNKPPKKDACAWFLHPVYDGYTGGRGRDLTQEPKVPNDLTLVEEAVRAIREPLPEVNRSPILAKALLYQGKMLGLLIRPADAKITLASARYLPPQTGKDEKPALLLLEVRQPEAQGKDRHETWRVTLDENPSIQRETDSDSLIRARLGLKKQEPIPPPDVFQSQSIPWGNAKSERVGGILVKCANGAPQLMGVAIPRDALQARAYDLRPENYLRAPEIRPELVRPHDILLQIHQRQQRLLRQMDRLAGWLVPEGPKEREGPLRLDGQEPLGALNETQQAIWENIRAQADGDRAQPFTVDDVKGNFDENEVRLALNLFEAMGLIVPITLRHPESGEPMNFYRLVEQNDHWAGPEGEKEKRRER